MVYYHNIYKGAGYGFSSTYSSVFEDQTSTSPEYPSTMGSNIGLATDPRSANQLKAASDKLNAGAKAVEISFVQSDVFESVPKQHFEELKRLKNLVGAELTLHAPVVEPTGITKQGWDETHRQQAERQMWEAIEKGHAMDPEGNTVITFHSSAGLPEMETKIIDDKTKKEEIKEFMVVNEREGQFTNLRIQPSYFNIEEEKAFNEGKISQQKLIEKTIKDKNQEQWGNTLQHINFNVNQGEHSIRVGLMPPAKEEGDEEELKLLPKSSILDFYGKFAKGNGEENKFIDSLKKEHGEKVASTIKQILLRKVTEIEHGDIYIRTAYGDLQKMFDQAYDAAKKIDDKPALAKLDQYRNEVVPQMEKIKTDPSRVADFAEQVQNGVHILRSLEITPQLLTPMKDFAIDKASDTFSDLAVKAYKQYGKSAPIISIENPPAGTALSRAEDLRELIDVSRTKFAKELVKSGKSEKEAKKEAEKLIGATWDVGHINMIRKYGYGEEQLKKEAEKIAPVVKHVHLSDNFGMEHTELPMGMGNVPTKAHLEAIEKYNKKVKKMIEAGNWHQYFQTIPLGETLSHFNSPVYAMNNAPYWSQNMGQAGSYLAGFGLNPDIHHQTFGAGFTALPVELGGQMSGRSRVSGAPID